MNNLLLIPMNSISTLIAEDTGTPELRNPLTYVQENSGKNCKSKTSNEQNYKMGLNFKNYLVEIAPSWDDF